MNWVTWMIVIIFVVGIVCLIGSMAYEDIMHDADVDRMERGTEE